MPEQPYVEAYGIRAYIGERRRYGRTTFTWVRFFNVRGTEYTRDPWPCIFPKKSEVLEACKDLGQED